MPGIGLQKLNSPLALQAFQVLRQGSVILASLLLARSGLGTEAIGHFEKLLYLGFALSFFWTTGLTQSFLSLFPGLKDGERPAARGTAYLLFSGISLVLLGTIKVLERPLLAFLTGETNLPHFDWFLLYLLFFLPAYLLEHFLLLDNRPRGLLALGLGSALGYLLAVAIPLLSGSGLKGIVVSLALFGALKHLALWIYLYSKAQWHWRGAFARQWIWLGLPLMAYSAMGGFHLLFDNWLVGFHFGEDARPFAYYRYGARELPFTVALTTALGTALLPVTSANMGEGLAAIRKRSLRLFHLLFPLSIALMLSSYWWFPWIFTDAFLPSVPVFNLFLLILTSRVLLSRTILMALHDNRIILWISLLELGVNVATSVFFLYQLGLPGIALGTVIAYSLERLLQVLYLKRKHGIRFSDYTDTRWWSFYTLALLTAFLISFWLAPG